MQSYSNNNYQLQFPDLSLLDKKEIDSSRLGLIHKEEEENIISERRKQGQTFLDETNSKVRNMSKQAVEYSDIFIETESKLQGHDKVDFSSHFQPRQGRKSVEAMNILFMNDTPIQSYNNSEKKYLLPGDVFGQSKPCDNQVIEILPKKQMQKEIQKWKESLEEIKNNSEDQNNINQLRQMLSEDNEQESKKDQIKICSLQKQTNDSSIKIPLSAQTANLNSYKESLFEQTSNNLIELCGNIKKQSFSQLHSKIHSSLELPNIATHNKSSKSCLESQSQRQNITSQNLDLQDFGNKKKNSGLGLKTFSLRFLISIKPKLKNFFINKTTFGRTKVLTKRIRNFIDDGVDFAKISLTKSLFQSILMNVYQNLEKISRILRLNKIPLFDPESKIKILLNSVIVAYNCFYMLMISIVLIFDGEMSHKQELIFNYIAMASWITEMIMEMNTVCYHNNHFVTDRRVIIKIYSKEYFFFEILPLIFEGRSSPDTLINVLLHLPLLLKIKGMSIILQKLEFYILQILDKHYVFQLFKLIMQMLLYGHIVACCWNLVVKVETHMIGTTTWIEHSEINTEHWYQRYLMAQYWAFSVMMNVTTIPTTPLELAFTSFVMLFSCIAFGYLLSTVSVIISDISKQQKDYKKDLNILNSYMKRKKVDLSVKRRVNIDLKTFYQQKSKDNLQEEKSTLTKISNEMINELNCQANARIIKQFPFFLKIFSEQTLTKMYSIMEEEVYAPQQTVINNISDPDNLYLYLILKGEEHFIASNEVGEDEIENYQEEDFNHYIIDNSIDEKLKQSMVRQNNSLLKIKSQFSHKRKVKNSEDKGGSKKKLGSLHKGQIFGAYQFFTGKEREQLELKCSNFTTLIKVKRQKFLDTIIDNKKDYEKFCEIRDKMENGNYIEDISDNCLICGSKDHNLEKCNFGFFHKSNILLIFKHNYSQQQERQKLQNLRILEKKGNSLKQLSLLTQKVHEFRERLNIDFSDYSIQDYVEDDEEKEISPIHQDIAKFQSNNSLAQKKHSSIDQDFFNNNTISSFLNNNHNQSQYIQNSPSNQLAVIPELELSKQTEEVHKSHNLLKKESEDIEDMSISSDEAKLQIFTRAKIKRSKSILKHPENQDDRKRSGSMISSSNRRESINMDQNTSKKKLSFIHSPMIKPYNPTFNQDIVNQNIQHQEEQCCKRKTIIQHHQAPMINSQPPFSTQFQQAQYLNGNPIEISQQIHQQYLNNNHNGTLNLNHGQQYYHYHGGSFLCHNCNISKQNSKEDTVSPNNKNKQMYSKRGSTHKISLYLNQADESSFIWGFDKQKDFQSYFPYYNCIQVMKRFLSYQTKSLRLKKQQQIKKIPQDISNKKKFKKRTSSNLANSKGTQLKINNFKLNSKLSREYSQKIVSLELSHKPE